MRNRNSLFIGAVIMLVLIVAGAAYVLRPTAAPSGELQAVAIDVATESPAEGTPAAEATEPAMEAEGDETASASAGGVYELEQSSSTVSFSIFEELRGDPTTVIGITDQVAGQILIDLENPSASQVGLVQVNARTLATDNENRNRAMRNEILDTDQFELISFEPIALQGLPDAVEVGGTYTFDILGNLTIRDITQEVVFTATIAIDSASQVSGTATAEVSRSAYSLIIPSVPFVANVSDDITLSIDFLATTP